jgi:hypothetical protein
MQRTADFYHQIAPARFPQSARVLDDAAALHAAVDVLDADPAPRDPSIGRFLPAREGPASGLLGRHNDPDLVERARQEAEILEQPAARGQGIGRSVCNPLVVGAPPRGGAQEQDRERGLDEQHIFHRVACFLTAITARLLSRILGALDAPFGPVMPKRGEGATGGGATGGGATAGGATAGGLAGDTGSASGTTKAAASASATPRRFANSVKERAGHPPRPVAPPAGRPTGHGATDGPCFGPSRRAVPAGLGADKSSHTPG